MLGHEEIENRFGTHKATLEGPNPSAETHASIRTHFKDLATYLDQVLPEGREKVTMFTNLETASMWAHKTLAKGQPLVHEIHRYEVKSIPMNHMEAVELVQNLKNIVKAYGYTTVADYYNLAGVMSGTDDQLFGWVDLSYMSIQSTNQTSSIVFPSARPIKEIYHG